MKIATRILLSSLFVAGFSIMPSRAQPPRLPALPEPTYSINLRGRDACVTPCTKNRARADGGIVDVQVGPSRTMTVSMTGTPAADSYLGCTSSAKQTYRLEQEFTVECSDPSVRSVKLTIDSSLEGYVRSVRRAAASVKLARVTVVSLEAPGSPMVLAHPPQGVSGTDGRLCNRHLEPLESPAMPVGRYQLIAEFELDTTASGICNAHAVADFSPDTSLPADWVRMRDPFQGVSKKNFGFNFSVTATYPAKTGGG
jgi:hypothetical protein